MVVVVGRAYPYAHVYTHANKTHGPAVGHGRHLLDRGREEVGGGPVVHLRIVEFRVRVWTYIIK